METIDYGDLIQTPILSTIYVYRAYQVTLYKRYIYIYIYIYKSFCKTKLIAKKTNFIAKTTN